MGHDYKELMFKVHLIDLDVRNSEADEDHANSQTDLGVRTVE